MGKAGKCDYMVWPFIQPVMWIKETAWTMLGQLHFPGLFCCSTSIGMLMGAVTFVSTAAGKLRVYLCGNNHLFTGNIS